MCSNIKKVLFFFFFSIFHLSILAQVGIGTTNPANSSKLEIASTDKGILIPRVALSSTNTAGPITGTLTEGLLVYNTATSGTSPNDVSPGFYYYTGTIWAKLGSQTSVNELTTNNYKSISVYETPGTYTWVVPDGIYKVTAEMWGAGGGTGGNGGDYRLYRTSGWIYSTGGTGAIGAQGGYNKITISVTPGQTFSVVVGAPGTTGTNGVGGENNTPATSGTSGGAGGFSKFHTYQADGGSGGSGGDGGYTCGYNCVSNGANGTTPAAPSINNYNYTYNSFQQLRSYIPAAYIPVYPKARSNAGEAGFVILFMGE